MPTISVVIPVYNGMKYLPETMESVLGQTFTDFEVIVVNDGSTDNTREWVEQIQDNRIRLINQTNQGSASAARNKGISQAKGDYIAFLDADDVWESTKLAKQLEAFKVNPEVGLVYTWVAYINGEGKSTGRVFQHQDEGEVWEKLVQQNIVECGSVAMVRRQCFTELGVFDQSLRIAEDWDMWLRIANNYNFAVVPEALVKYRQHANSKSKNYPSMLGDFRIIVEKAFQSAPFEKLHLRNISYGKINFCLAWKCLQSTSKDYQKAEYFLKQALLHCSNLRFSKEYFRLSIAITMMKLLGAESYSKFLGLAYVVRRQLSISSK